MMSNTQKHPNGAAAELLRDCVNAVTCHTPLSKWHTDKATEYPGSGKSAHMQRDRAPEALEPPKNAVDFSARK